ncbi:MAG: type II toxin-antitoxin system RelB/DinJ family antitoxin [Eggerthellaceae bacterium]
MAKFKMEIDGKTLRAAEDVADLLGLDLNAVTKAFFRQIARERRIPLDLSLSEPHSAQESSRAASFGEALMGANAASLESVDAPTGAAPTAEAVMTPSVPTGSNESETPVAVKKPTPDIVYPSVNSIPSEDELLERMLEAQEEAEKEEEAKEAVERDRQRREKRQAEMDRAFDEAAAKRKEEAVPQENTTETSPNQKQREDGGSEGDEKPKKRGGWRDSWLFEGDDPDDELLFSPYEI